MGETEYSALERKKVLYAERIQSLIGLLSHACKVVHPGRVFLGRTFRLAATVRPSHRLRLNRDFQSDLEWWHRFLEGWNGTSLCAQFDPKCTNVITSDASGK